MRFEQCAENGYHSSKARHSPQKPAFALSKAQPGSKAVTGTKTPPLPTKKTKMQTTDSDCSFEALQVELPLVQEMCSCFCPSLQS